METSVEVDLEPRRLLNRDFVVSCVGRGVFFSSMSMLLPVLPLFAMSIGGSEAIIGLIVGMFTVSIVILSPFIGRAADESGRKGLMFLGSAIFLASSLLYNFVLSIPLLFVLRVFHGAGLANYNIASSAYAADVSPPQRRGEAMGWYGLSNNVAMALGPALGMTVYQGYGFNALFLASASLAALSLILTFFLTEPAKAKLPPGAARGQLFSRAALFPSAVMASLSLTWGTIVAFVPLYAFKNGIENPGLYFTAWSVALVFSRTIAGALSDRFGRGSVTVPGLILASVAVWMLPSATSFNMLMASALVYGLGFGAVHPALMALAFDVAGAKNKGASMATFGMAFDVGIGLGSIFLGLVLQFSDFSTMFIVAGAVPLLGVAAFGWKFLRERAM